MIAIIVGIITQKSEDITGKRTVMIPIVQSHAIQIFRQCGHGCTGRMTSSQRQQYMAGSGALGASISGDMLSPPQPIGYATPPGGATGTCAMTPREPAPMP